MLPTQLLATLLCAFALCRSYQDKTLRWRWYLIDVAPVATSRLAELCAKTSSIVRQNAYT